MPPEIGRTDPAHPSVAVEREQPVSAVQDSQHCRLWVSQDPQDPQDKTDHTLKGEGIVHIPAAPSFVDRGSIHTPQGSEDIKWVAFGLANSPAVAVGEDTAAAQHNSMPEMASEGRALDNIHMDNHQVGLAGK